MPQRFNCSHSNDYRAGQRRSPMDPPPTGLRAEPATRANLDTGRRRAVTSRGGKAFESLVRNAVRPPTHTKRTQTKAMDLMRSALIARPKVTPTSGDADGRSVPASS
jgi:hypothetical protein